MDRHYSSELVVGLLEMWGVDVQGLSVSRVSRLSRRGKELHYHSVVGPLAAMRSLESKRDTLKGRGWRIGRGDFLPRSDYLNGSRSWDVRRVQTL